LSRRQRRSFVRSLHLLLQTDTSHAVFGNEAAQIIPDAFVRPVGTQRSEHCAGFYRPCVNASSSLLLSVELVKRVALLGFYKAGDARPARVRSAVSWCGTNSGKLKRRLVLIAAILFILVLLVIIFFGTCFERVKDVIAVGVDGCDTSFFALRQAVVLVKKVENASAFVLGGAHSTARCHKVHLGCQAFGAQNDRLVRNLCYAILQSCGNSGSCWASDNRRRCCSSSRNCA